jgi:octaheme c-type cytochrome (tetrathionate reductase family)
MKSKNTFLKVFFTFMAIIAPWVLAIMLYKGTNNFIPPKTDLNQVTIVEVQKTNMTNPKKFNVSSKVDHTKFAILQQEFKSPQEVTKACLSCHNKSDHEIMMSSHWKWTRATVNEKGDTVEYGKKNLINNFCIGIASNETKCTSCHIGFGWKDNKFDFNKSENIDCIICHDQTGTYAKSNAGMPVTDEQVIEGKTYSAPDYNLIAQNIGEPTRENCGVCHYYGGGGNNVKHGDLSKELSNTNKDVDIHMGIDGANMNCTECHKTENHKISGKLYSVSSDDKDRVTCSQCHSEKPHKNAQLNLHSNKVACQTCHIPEYAKDNPTKMTWDWSEAGKLNPDGSQITTKDSLGNVIYMTKKGSFTWGKHVKPEYVWFNGKAKHYITGDTIDSTQVLKVNTLLGSYSDPKSKIIPVKVFRGKQIFDPVTKMMITPHLFGKDSTAFWTNFDWDKASATGMASLNLPYSGKYAFVSTEMYWPLNHMVSKSSEALSCTECHSHDGRLKELNDFYLIGRDSSSWIDWMGILMIVGALIGVTIHASLRIFKSKKVK